MNLPDVENVIEVIYRYRTKSGFDREFYIDGEELKKFFSQLGGASLISVIHGQTFEPLNWKIRKRNVNK